MKAQEITELYRYVEHMGKKIESLMDENETIKKKIVALDASIEWITVSEFAELAGLKPKTVSNYCSRKWIQKCKKVNGIYLIHRSELEVRKKLLNSNKHTLMDNFLGNV